MRLHCRGALTHFGRNHPHTAALTVSGATYSFAALHRETVRVARSLRARGVGQGDAVCLVCPNSVDFVVGLLACVELGAVFSPLTFTAPSGPILAQIEDVGARAVIVHDGYRHRDALLAGLIGLVAETRVVAVPTREAEAHDGDDHDDDGFSDVAWDDRCAVLYSSGTTARPKGIVKTHFEMSTTALLWALELRLGFGDAMLLSTPLYYTGGLELLLASVVAGAHTVLTERFDVTGWADAVARYQITHTFLVPTQVRRLLMRRAATRRTKARSWCASVTGRLDPCATLSVTSNGRFRI